MNILITGTSRGLGQYLAETLLNEGHVVFGCSSGGNSTIEHANYKHFKADVRNEANIKDMLNTIRRNFGHLDALINNAGVASMNHVMITPTDAAQRIIDINFMGTFIVSREASKLIKKSSDGRIINFTTVASPLSLEGEAIYASSKAAVEKLTQVMAKEMAPFNITVNAIGPTPVQTALIAGVPVDKINLLLERQSIKRMGTREDVYNVINFFLNPKSNFITGQILYLGGVF